MVEHFESATVPAALLFGHFLVGLEGWLNTPYDY